MRDLEALLDALRLRAVDVVGVGFGDRVARRLGAARGSRVRRGVTLAEPDERSAARRAAARESADALRARLCADLPRALAAPDRTEVEQLLRGVDDRRLLRGCRELDAPLAVPRQPWSVVEDDVFAEPARLFERLAR